MHPILYGRPDRLLSSGRHHGLEWVALHNGLGFMCGYVKIPHDHPWTRFRLFSDFGDVVYNGVTYLAESVDRRGGPDGRRGWWVGFHAMGTDDLPDPSLPVDEHLRDAGMFHDFATKIITRKFVESECCFLCEAAVRSMPNRSLLQRIKFATSYFFGRFAVSRA